MTAFDAPLVFKHPWRDGTSQVVSCRWSYWRPAYPDYRLSSEHPLPGIRCHAESEPSPIDRMTHYPDQQHDTKTTLPPSSHAKPVDTFAPATELEAELKRVIRGDVRFDRGTRAM